MADNDQLYTPGHHSGQMDQRLNSTDYIHPQETNLLNLVKAMQYNTIGQPVIRTHVDGITLEGDVLVSNVTIDSGNVTVWQGTDPWKITGNANITNMPSITGNVIITSGNIDANVHGNVGILTMPNVNASVTGNVIVSSGNIDANVHGNVGIVGNVNVTQGTDPWQVSGTIFTQAAPGTTETDFFGTPLSITMVPYVQVNSYEGLDPTDSQTYSSGGGSVVEADTDINVSCSTTPGSYGVYRSRRFIPYRPGQSGIGRVLGEFGTPQLGIQQRIGIANQESGYFIGYNGANDSAGAYNDLKFLHTYGGRAEIWSLTVTGTASGNQSVTVTLNGVAHTVNLLTGDTASVIANKISNAIDGLTWLCNSKDNVVTFLSGAALGNLTGTFSVTDTGNVTYVLNEEVSGVAATNEYIGITVPANIDLTKYNTWQFRYVWTGVEVYVLDTDVNQMKLILQHGLSSDNTLPVRKPAFKPTVVCVNTGGSVATTMRISYLFGATEGDETITKYTYGGGVTKASLASGTYHHIMSVQNPYVNQLNKINFRTLRFYDLTVAVQCNDPVEFYIVLNADLTNGSIFDWQRVDGQLYTQSTATGAVDFANNTPVAALISGSTGSGAQFDLRTYHLIVPPGDRMSLVAYSTATLQKVTIAGTWGLIG